MVLNWHIAWYIVVVHSVEFQDFSVIQILREMDCEGTTCRRSKTASFCNFRALNLDNLVNFSLQKVQNSDPLNVLH